MCLFRLIRVTFFVSITGFFVWFLLHVNQSTVRINNSGSMPKGLYRTTNKVPQMGDTVTVCLPPTLAQFAYQRHYIGAGHCPKNTEPLVKQIVAVGGDVVVVTKAAVSVNGKPLLHSAQLATDAAGRFMPAVAAGTYRLQPSQVWLYGTTDARSWDSRYFGAVEKTTLRHVLVPTLLW
jgi:conjugative transfer signal peptidase TraF